MPSTDLGKINIPAKAQIPINTCPAKKYKTAVTPLKIRTIANEVTTTYPPFLKMKVVFIYFTNPLG